MKKFMLPAALGLIILFTLNYLYAQPVKQVKISSFDMLSSAQVNASGEELSTIKYHSPVYWFPVKVPSTVLGGLVANHIYPSPYQGMNNMLIPDASDQFNKE